MGNGLVIQEKLDAYIMCNLSSMSNNQTESWYFFTFWHFFFKDSRHFVHVNSSSLSLMLAWTCTKVLILFRVKLAGVLSSMCTGCPEIFQGIEPSPSPVRRAEHSLMVMVVVVVVVVVVVSQLSGGSQ